MEKFILIIFFALMVGGVPIGFSLGLTAVFGLLKLGDPVFLNILSTRFFSGMNSYVLLALPFFILAGEIMNKAGLTKRLTEFANVLFGALRGGFAQVNIVTSILFGGISGSAAADAAALGSIFIPAMTKEGYDKDFSTAVTIASSIIAPIIPPSMIMVIYGAITGTSIAGLFSAGIIPGLIIGLGLMIFTHFVSIKRSYPQHKGLFSVRKLALSTKRSFLALITPVIILGGILGGFYTPTEAGAIAVGYALFLGMIVYRTIGFKDMYPLLYRTSEFVGLATLILSSAAVLSWLLASEQIPQKVANLFLTVTDNKILILLMINIFVILVGMFMDSLASVIILVPTLAPLAIGIGVDPLHFGIMMCINLNISLMTPPMGACIFMGMIVSELPMWKIVKELWPYILVEYAVLFLVVYIPSITMFVPRLLGFAN